MERAKISQATPSSIQSQNLTESWYVILILGKSFM